MYYDFKDEWEIIILKCRKESILGRKEGFRKIISLEGEKLQKEMLLLFEDRDLEIQLFYFIMYWCRIVS